MKLGEKVRYLRVVEGNHRGFSRPMTQIEVVRAMRRELKGALSQSYLSQIENGSRPHLTNTTRTLLARFFKVHPGFLVDDPKGFPDDFERDLGTSEGKLDAWFVKGAERFINDPELSGALMRIAGQHDSRSAVLLLDSILQKPRQAKRLAAALRKKP